MFNLLLVWAATGIWHGASWNYLLWGLYFWVLLMAEKLFLGKYLDKAPPFLGHLYTMLLVMIGWGIFALENMGQLGSYLRVLFGFGQVPFWNAEAGFYLKSYFPVLLAAVLASTPLGVRLYRALPERAAQIMGILLLAAALLVCTAYLVAGTYNPFLYFRF